MWFKEDHFKAFKIICFKFIHTSYRLHISSHLIILIPLKYRSRLFDCNHIKSIIHATVVQNKIRLKYSSRLFDGNITQLTDDRNTSSKIVYKHVRHICFH